VIECFGEHKEHAKLSFFVCRDTHIPKIKRYFGNEFYSLPFLFMKKIDYKNKFVVICAWCELDKGKKYEKK